MQKDRDDVGIATILGFLGVLALLVLVTMLSYGILLRPELRALATPSMAGVLETIVGPWGKIFISVGLLISVLGNYLSWSLLAAEVLHSAAVNRTMPSFLAYENAKKVPAGALWLTNIVIQLFLLVTYFAEYAFTLALKMTSSMTLIPYLFVAAYGLKLAWTGETYAVDPHGRAIDWIRGAIATVYAAGMIYAGGAKFLLLSAFSMRPERSCSFLPDASRRRPLLRLSRGFCSALSSSQPPSACSVSRLALFRSSELWRTVGHSSLGRERLQPNGGFHV
jgi:arginine:ornithine antiporter/lysine permease